LGVDVQGFRTRFRCRSALSESRQPSHTTLLGLGVLAFVMLALAPSAHAESGGLASAYSGETVENSGDPRPQPRKPKSPASNRRAASRSPSRPAPGALATMRGTKAIAPASRATRDQARDLRRQPHSHHPLYMGRRTPGLGRDGLRLLRLGLLPRYTAANCSKRRSSPAPSPPGANRARGSGSRSTPTRNTSTWSSPASAGTPAATSPAKPARAGTPNRRTRKGSSSGIRSATERLDPANRGNV